ncbi:MAG: type II toxin-antitoxin system HicA family toxin [Thiocapsa sp.]|uniref:type II toxin-antitoxin system HicA family toxin n=1 Tax=Thiocapsa sp. TaxID=2024551 RepID=UPI001BCD6936|nr:type II toxin-antitoxin system HicA family toxin [Thiocapsa sp.]QVL51221.1 MAG: type II toxin-antitoxin system HicA family toxin [Thiocapsa sp.]
MPRKIRQLKSLLLKAGCLCERAKGSHTKWSHPRFKDKLILSGHDGDDAKPYQEQTVLRYLYEIAEES